MSIIRKSNNFKTKQIGSVKDYKDKYDYLNQRDEQIYGYKRNNKQRTIERVKQDKELNLETLKADIENKKNRNKLKLVKLMTQTHPFIVALFSIISGILSSIGIASIVGINTLGGISIIILAIIMIYGANAVIQPTFINSLDNKPSIKNYIGSALLGIVMIGVFYVSCRTNKKTLDLVNLPADLSLAFTFVFDVSVLGLNFLHYSICLFNVKDRVKKDLGIIEEQQEQKITRQLPVIIEKEPTNIIGFTGSSNTKTSDKIINYLDSLQDGDPVNLKDVDCNYSTGLKFLNANENKLPIIRDTTNSKNKYMKKGY